MNHSKSPIAIIIPACNEEACLGPVLEELLAALDPEQFVVAVGVNDSTDGSAEVARRYPVLVAETEARGYGHGCMAAIEAVNEARPETAAYIFMAADGASDPADVATLGAAYEQGYGMVLGGRTRQRRNWVAMTAPHVVANFLLGTWCGLLTGRWFSDLGPMRLIERRLFEELALQEMTFGWTIEAQVGAARLGAAICEVPAHERARLAGEQKVSGVSWRRSFSIG
ncbi:MAG: glycosyltransferase family 2 protein, partial [Chthoniobacterales bacterium]